MRNFILFIFILSIICPVYTYAVYPIVLTILPKKKRSFSETYQTSVCIITFEKETVQQKKLRECCENCDDIKEKIDIITIKNIEELNEYISSIDTNIIIFMNGAEEYETHTIRHILIPFSDRRIGCVVGMQRKLPDKNGDFQDGVYWKYENYVRQKESEIGCVSGANRTIYAVRRSLIPSIPEDINNLGFYLSMWIAQKGWDVYFEPKAVAYEKEEDSEGVHFIQHVEEAEEYWRSLAVFWRMLLPVKGSFIYVSHRVMKWLVPFCLISLFASSFILGYGSNLFIVPTAVQMIGYIIMTAWIKCKPKWDGTVAKILDIAGYFLVLNVSIFIGLLRTKKRRI